MSWSTPRCVLLLVEKSRVQVEWFQCHPLQILGVRACWGQGWKFEVRFWDALPGKSFSEIISGTAQQCQLFSDKTIRR